MDFIALGKKLPLSLVVRVCMFLYSFGEGSGICSPLPGEVGSAAIRLVFFWIHPVYNESRCGSGLPTIPCAVFRKFSQPSSFCLVVCSCRHTKTEDAFHCGSEEIHNQQNRVWSVLASCGKRAFVGLFSPGAMC